MKKHNTKKYLIILGGGILQLPLIKQAIEMNFIPIVFDYNKNAEAFKIDEVVKIVVSTQDIEKATKISKKLSKKYSIYGVLTSGTDVSQTVSSIAQELKLIGNPQNVAISTTDKLTMRETLKQNNISQPYFFEVTSIDNFNNLLYKIKNNNNLKKLFYDGAVIKPSLNMGARGVVYIPYDKIINFENHFDYLKNLYLNAKNFSKNKKVIFENYIKSYELSIDALIYNETIYITGVADRFIQQPPYFVELGHFMPSQLDKKLIETGITVFKNAIKALNIKSGAAKGDIRVRYNKNNQPEGFIGEVASRLSGGFMSTHTFPYSSGINLMEKIIQIHTDSNFTPPEPKWEKYSVELGIIPQKEGILKSVKGINDAFYIQEIKNIFITKKIGNKIIIPRNNTQKIGNIIAVSENKDKVLQSAKQALKTINPIIL